MIPLIPSYSFHQNYSLRGTETRTLLFTMKAFPLVCSYSRPGGKEKGDIQRQDKETFLAG